MNFSLDFDISWNPPPKVSIIGFLITTPMSFVYMSKVNLSINSHEFHTSCEKVFGDHLATNIFRIQDRIRNILKFEQSVKKLFWVSVLKMMV